MSVYEHYRETGFIEPPIQPRSDEAYDRVRDYRYALECVVDKAKRHAETHRFDWAYGRLYLAEINSIPVPPVPDYNNQEDVEAATEELRKLVQK